MNSKGTMIRASAVVLLGAALAATAGCSSAGSTVSTTPGATVTPTATAPSTTVTTTPPSTPSTDGCPVDEKTLEAAFHANSQISSAILLGGGFVDIKCASGYAIATATPTNMDHARVVFQYDQAAAAWKAVTAGTGFDCTDFMSPDIANQLGC